MQLLDTKPQPELVRALNEVFNGPDIRPSVEAFLRRIQESDRVTEKPLIIGIGHKMKSGKDAVANHLVLKHGFVKLGFADPLRDILWKMNPNLEPCGDTPYQELVKDEGYDKAKDNPLQGREMRRLLQALGAAVRDWDEDFWAMLGYKRAFDAAYGDELDVVFSDMRHKNEARIIKDMGGFTVKVNGRFTGRMPSNHKSETDLDDYEFDYTIENDGTLDDLRRKADEMVRHFRSGNA